MTMMMMVPFKVIFSICFISTFLVSSSSLVVVEAAVANDGGGEEICHPGSEDGVCFANADAAEAYYKDGQEVVVDYGVSQQVAGKDYQDTLDVLAKSKEYVAQVRTNETLGAEVQKECKVRHKLCSFWAAIGECEKNPAYMLLQCAPSCGTCDQLSYDIRCPYDKDAPTIWEKDDLNKMFERITTDEYYISRYSPTILSRPSDDMYELDKPWVVTLENVLTEQQCEKLIQLGKDRGYERSQDVGKKKFDGTYDGLTSESRTSSNTWCLDKCYDDPVTKEVLKTIENITAIPDSHGEYLQLLEYEVGEYYQEHHDYIFFHNQRPQGVRILTVFLYLNDVEEGGGTRFGNLDITVQPKRGRALIWPSVKNKNPNKKDSWTHHEAMPVIKGIKYGANAWIHQRDFKTPFENKCS